MDVDIKCKGSYAMATIVLNTGERLLVERGAMVATSPGLDVSAGLNASLPKAIVRRWLGRENLILTRFTAQIQDAFVLVAPPYPGDMVALTLNGQEEWRAQIGSLVACGSDVEVDVRPAGLTPTLLREGVAVLGLSGRGKAVLASYGGLLTFTLREGEELIVDTGHLVAWTHGIDMRVGPFSSVVNAMLTGEGLVAHLSGPGKVCVQTRAEQGMRSWLLPEGWQNKKS